MNLDKFSTGWPDALSKLGLAIVAICTLITTLVTRCDSQRHEKQIQQNATRTEQNSQFLNRQFSWYYSNTVNRIAVENLSKGVTK